MANPFDDDAPTTTSRSTNPFGDDDDTPTGGSGIISRGINEGTGRSSRPGVVNHQQHFMSSTPQHSSKRLILDDPTDTSDLNNESSWQDLGDLPYRR